MLQLERFRKIEEIVQERGQISVAELESVLDTSKATIYRDLRELNKNGKLQIVRGGVSSVTYGKIFEQAYDEKRHVNTREKQRIAKAAMDYIKPNQTIFLDSSSTVIEMAPELLARKQLQIITNDVKISSELSNASDLNVFVTGGLLRKGYYTLTGVMAQNFMSKIRIDVAFMGCDAIDVSNGCMITNMEEVSIKHAVCSRSTRSIILCDHSKFGKFAFASFCDMEQIDTIITGTELADDVYKRYVEAGVNIIRV